MSAASVSPLASTDFSPPVYVRRMVGILTSMAMGMRTPENRGCVVRDNTGTPPYRPTSANALDRLLGDLALDDPERAELRLLVRPGRNEDVVGVRLLRQADVGARRVRLGGRMRVVDDDRLLVVGVHLLVQRE